MDKISRKVERVQNPPPGASAHPNLPEGPIDIAGTVEAVREWFGIPDRPMRAKDFRKICKAEGIEILGSAVHGSTFIFKMKGETFIVISDHLRGRRRLLAMFHELGHYFCQHKRDSPRPAFYPAASGKRNHHEVEADRFAEIATGLRYIRQ